MRTVGRMAAFTLAVGTLGLLAQGCGSADTGAGGADPTPPPVAASWTHPSPTPRETIFQQGLVPSRTAERGLWLAWSLIDLENGQQIGSANSESETTNAESVIKVWIAADYIIDAEQDDRNLRDYERARISRTIRYSDDAAAEALYRARGGDVVLRRLTDSCGVSAKTTRRGYWSFAQLSAIGAARMLACITAQASAGSAGLSWLLTEMENVAPEGAFGLSEALPPETPSAVKNGWTRHSASNLWNVNCLGTWDHYALSVLTRYSASLDLEYGASVCREVTQEILARL